tara:strand:+ start:5849 stop:5962 length:114 start_codon:yes stop_codon:yes gene_type:complete
MPVTTYPVAGFGLQHLERPLQAAAASNHGGKLPGKTD